MDEVRRIIRKILKEEVGILNERLMDVGDDVNYIYDNYFKLFVETVEKTRKVDVDTLVSSTISTSELKSPLAVKASKLNPCDIAINQKRYGSSNFYAPLKNLISIGTNTNAIEYALSNVDNNVDYAAKMIELDYGKTTSKVFLKEFSESKIKGSIHHELAHWIDDTLHNKHLRARSLKVGEGSSRDMTRKGIPINADYMEIQAQIHNVLQLKNKYFDIWDIISFGDLIEMSPTIHNVYNKLEGNTRIKWVRDLKTRMHREGLLGKNMVNK